MSFDGLLNRVVCADALDYLSSIPDVSVDCVCTDPPYPIDRSNGTGRLLEGHRSVKEWFVEGYSDWSSFWFAVCSELYRVLKPGGHLYVFSNESNLWQVKALTEGASKNMLFKSLLVWHKGDVLGQCYGMGYHYRKSCEYVLLYSKGKSARHIKDHGTLLHYPRNSYNSEHPTPKPVALLSLLVEKSVPVGGIVLDPFSGGGSLPVAARRCGRNFLACDIDERFVNSSNKLISESVLLERWF